ncbi:MAG: hypothetical protein QOK31_226 [Solirubrobacteraceae bacterium]|jgi:2-hydroxychromene-2-carboxylate isomerase|nr:hypothetical protein [Solirubrobacteraceae bacterium]
MGDLILLADRRAARRSRPRAPAADGAPFSATLWFDLTSPFTYLAAERAERAFPRLRWRPTYAALRHAHVLGESDRALAERRAEALGMPLVWPERVASHWRAAARAAAHAADLGRGAEFVLAAGRLAFCGGFDLDDPEVLAEAGEAAGIMPSECLAVAAATERDAVIEVATDCLEAAGADAVPTLQIGQRLFCGEHRLSEAIAVAGSGTQAGNSPLPHVS